MKTNVFKNISLILCLILTISFGLGLLLFENSASAEEDTQTPFSQTVVSDENFSLTMRVTPRNETSVLPLIQETYETVDGEITYFCFQWRDLNTITFNIENSFNTNLTFKSYSLLMTYARTDDLTQSILSENNTPKKLITSDYLQNNTFTYNIDKDAPISSGNIRGNYGFGLYRFQLVYKFSEQQTSTTSTKSIGNIYVAVIPDDIDKITSLDIQKEKIEIRVRVSSANNLMNKYGLWLSSDLFTYVNPKYIKWEITGKDRENNVYVLTKDMQEENPNSKVLYETPDYSPYGNSYDFESKGIEGLWDVECKILWKNPPENVDKKDSRCSFTVTGLSTYKVEHTTNIWWIILIAIGILLLIIIIAIILIVYYKKKEKVW